MNFKTGKRFNKRQILWAFLAVSIILHSCGKDHKPNEQPDRDNPPNTKPVIVSFSPARGTPGTEITITGKNFKENVLQNAVWFQGAALEALVTQATTTALKVKVPQDAVTGKIIVKAGNQSDTSDTDFIVDPEMTAITDFTPKQGPFGTTVTITGKKFANDITVKINGIQAQVKQRNTTTIVFTIPTNTTLTAHKIAVTSGTDVLETTDLFTVTAAGPYAFWENKNIEFLTNGGSAFAFGASFVYKNKIYWGFTELASGTNQAGYAVYDPAQPAKGWQLQNPPPADMAPATNLHATVVVHNDRVFMGTGLRPSASSQWWEFHPETNTATRLTDFPQAVSGAVAFTLNNKIFVGFGGDNKNLYHFNPAGNNNQGSWNLSATGTFRELNTGNAFVVNNEVFLGRALPDLLQSRNAVYKFTEGGGIVRVTDMPEDVQSFTTPSFTIGNKGYFVTGKNVWEYTPDTNGGTWRAVISRPDAPMINHVAVLTVNGARVVYGWTSSGRLHEFKFN